MKHSKNTINKLKVKMKRTTQEVRKEEVSKHNLTNVINFFCSNWNDVQISHNMPSEDKVLMIGKITSNIKKKVTELEEKRRPNTPPEVLARRSDTITQ